MILCNSHDTSASKEARPLNNILKGNTPLNCPVCHSSLKRGIDKYSQTEIDYCPGCKGIWLDEDEIRRVCRFAAKEVAVPSNAEHSKRLCPHCQTRMHEFQYPETMVHVDMCITCGGFWLDSGELNEIDLVRKNWATDIARKLSRKKKNKQRAKGLSQYHEHDMSSLDFSFGNKKVKFLGNLVKALVACFIIAIAYWGYDSYVNGWKKHAARTREYLKTSFSPMPQYNQYQSYLDEFIDTQHEQIIQQCHYDKKVRGRRYSKYGAGHSYTYYETFFNSEKYLRLMDEEIRRQAQADQKTEIIDWLDTQKKKEERKEERERNWYMDELR